MKQFCELSAHLCPNCGQAHRWLRRQAICRAPACSSNLVLIQCRIDPKAETPYAARMIILLGSEKGGCGKSTLAVNIAAALAAKGDVVLLDADAQGTSAQWSQDREETDAPKVACVQKHGNVKQTVQDLAKRYQHVVIDAGGRDSQELRSGLLAADLVVCPFRPSQADVDTAQHLADVISAARDFNEPLRVAAVLTLCPTNPAIKEIQDARDYLKEIEGMKPLKAVIYDRKIYRDALSTGLGATESKNPKAAAEITALLRELKVK